ncbi:hypothetical protein GCM10025795_31530 [Verticiella sediminum]
MAQGTARRWGPEEYMPQPTVGRIPLFSALVIGPTVYLVDCHAWTAGMGVRTGSEAEQVHLERHNRHCHCLARTIPRLQAGMDPRLVGYGDSITAQGEAYDRRLVVQRAIASQAITRLMLAAVHAGCCLLLDAVHRG